MAARRQGEVTPQICGVGQVLHAIEGGEEGKEADGTLLALRDLVGRGAAVRPAGHPDRGHEAEDLDVVRAGADNVLDEHAARVLLAEGELPEQRDFQEADRDGDERKAPHIPVLHEARCREADAEDPRQHDAGPHQRQRVAVGVSHLDVREDEAGEAQAQEACVHEEDLGTELGKEADGISALQDLALQDDEGNHGGKDLRHEVPDGVAPGVVVRHVLVHHEAAPNEQQRHGEGHTVGAVQDALHLQKDVLALAAAHWVGVSLELHGRLFTSGGFSTGVCTRV
mmetsp:Transcript_132686/g.322415  ORF Transcript_132686/g.322415 Transcript_132686/m.322415 type:complete len:283 (-) Transcript_132686:40-888(-)